MLSRRYFVIRLVGAILFINAFVFALAALALFQSRQQHENRVMIQTQNLAHALELSIASILEKTDVALVAVADQAEEDLKKGPLDLPRLNGYAARLSARISEVDNMRVADQQGNVAFIGTNGKFSISNIADRDYFIKLRGNPELGMVISKPIFGRIAKKWLVNVARRINYPDGSFAGVAQGAISIEYLVSSFSSFQIGKHGVVTLRDGDLDVVARYPETQKGVSTIASKVVSRELTDLVRAGKTEGTYLTPGSIDSIERTFSFRKVSQFPLYVNVGRSSREYLIDWRLEVAKILALVLLFSLGTIFSSRAIYSKWKIEQQAEEELRKANGVLETRVAERTEQLFRTNEQLQGELAERKRAEETRNKALNFVETLLASSPTGIVVYNGITGQCMMANQAIADIVGGKVEYIQPNNFRNIQSWKEAGFDAMAEAVVADGTTRHVEKTYTSSFGKSVSADCFFSRFDADGTPHLLLIMVDVAEKKRLEQENKLIEAQMLHVQKLESLGVLAGGIAHDFNNILVAVLGNADLAMMRLEPDSPARENLLQIEKAGRRAGDLARQMLAYSGRGRFVSENLDVRMVIEEMTEILEVSISKKATIRYQFAPDLPAVNGDATQLRQVIMNLVINAAEAIEGNNGSISISAGSMYCDEAYLASAWIVDSLSENHYVYLDVTDNGCGIDDQVLPKIFDPFFTTKFTGRGLGMAAVLGIVRGHKGAIKVYSKKGKGTTFRILLPAIGQPADQAARSGSKVDGWKGAGTVLLVDDEEPILRMGQDMLQMLGYKVVTASDGHHALQVFRHHREEINCVLLDLTMPRMDGEQTFRELRLLDPNIPVLMSSGYNEHEVTQKFAGKGLAGFIQKPYNIEEVRTKLRQASVS